MDASAWKTDDKAWMKERRAGWKEVKSTLDCMNFLRGKDKKYLKEFYMTGQCSLDEMRKVYGRRFDFDNPLKLIEAPVLLECWLTADQSQENWEEIKAKYEERRLHDSRRRFLESLAYYPESGFLFGGLEERLYNFICPTRCRPEDYPNFNEDQYINHAWGIYGNVRQALTKFLESESPNPNNFVRYRLDEWADTISPTFSILPKELLDDLYQVINPMCDILADPDSFSPLAVEVATKVRSILTDDSLPEPVKERVEELIQSMSA